MGPIGAQEMFLIFILALLLFGPKKLPELGRLLGKGLTEFRRAKNELKTTFESHMHELEKEVKLSEQADKPSQWDNSSHWDQSSSTHYSSGSYPHTYDEYGREESTADNGTSPHDAIAAPSQEASAQHASPEPVSGTVPRSKPSPVAEDVNAPTEENHPA